MSAVQSIFDKTKELLTKASEPVSKEMREELIQKLDSLLDEREPFLRQLAAPFSALEEKQLEQIASWNIELVERMTSIKEDIQKDLVNVKKAKTHTVKYVNPYQSVSIDGMFYDKRN
ncbi:flagellar protein FliT [Metabacillus sp. GX 13764]|uniref:flagellar protein FliT n=1 Tax=Metabacillus kandeliae TaxID=2900151 RepID=UPI001E47A26F|nr:flagellar protein FliT [Metabacillus kandeliae]MCD7034439.1 flagellar protein FliT [Metabacillus kandeliae]